MAKKITKFIAKTIFRRVIPHKSGIENYVLLTAAVTSSFFLYDTLVKPVMEAITYTSRQENVIKQVKPGSSTAFLNSILGTPIKVTENNGYDLSLYKRERYWIQAISKAGKQETSAIAITACKGFTPTIEIPTLQKLQLNKDTFGSLNYRSNTGQYFLRGASRPTNIYEYSYLAAAGNYQSIALGYVEGCRGSDFFPFKGVKYDMGKIYYSDEDIKDILDKLIINTILVTSPNTDFEEVRSAYQAKNSESKAADIGVDLRDAVLFSEP